MFLVIYLLYKLIFDFIVPVYKASSQMRSKMNEMNQQQQQYYQQQQSAQTHTEKEKSDIKPAKEDYIDFEEVK